MNKILIRLTLISLMLASCTKKQEAMLSPEQLREQDSLALHIAVMPVMSCLPVYYAERTGMTDSAGLDIRLIRHTAQMDIDTTIQRGHAEIAISDLIRSIRLQAPPFLAMDEEMTLIAQKGKRTRKLKEVKEKMVAIARLSITDYWCDRMLDSARLEERDIFRPQINDVTLRATMLSKGTMEAAMTSEPYTTWLLMEGNKKLYTSRRKPALAAWIMADSIKADTFRLGQIEKFVAIYNAAIEKINKGEMTDTVRAILMQDYMVPAEIVDSIRLSALPYAFAPAKEDLVAAQGWLSKSNALPKNFSIENFIISIGKTKEEEKQ